MVQPSRIPSRERRGFTILELLIILALLTITASVGIPAYFARPAVTLDSAARLLAADLHEVQNRAALYQQPLSVRFSETGSGYTGVTASGDPLRSPYDDGPFARTYDADAVFEGVRVREVRSAEGTRITFSPKGLAATTASIVLGFENETRTVRIKKGSGLVEIDGLDDEWFDTSR